MLEKAKIFGTIASLIFLINIIWGFVIGFMIYFIPVSYLLLTLFSTVVIFAALVLNLLALKYASTSLSSPNIFKNFSIFFFLTIIAYILVIAGSFPMLSILEELREEIASHGSSPEYWIMIVQERPEILTATNTMMVAAIAAVIVFIISAVFLRKSYSELGEKTGSKLFKTTGTIYLVGSILMLAFGLGGFLIVAAIVLQLISFLTMPTKIPSEVKA